MLKDLATRIKEAIEDRNRAADRLVGVDPESVECAMHKAEYEKARDRLAHLCSVKAEKDWRG